MVYTYKRHFRYAGAIGCGDPALTAHTRRHIALPCFGHCFVTWEHSTNITKQALIDVGYKMDDWDFMVLSASWVISRLTMKGSEQNG